MGGGGWLYGKVKGLIVGGDINTFLDPSSMPYPQLLLHLFAISAACEFPRVDSIFTASQGTEPVNSMNKNKPSPVNNRKQ